MPIAPSVALGARVAIPQPELVNLYGCTIGDDTKQDPPELLTRMVESWRTGVQVVWAVRRRRPGEPGHTMFAALYYWLLRRVVGMSEMPATGTDYFLIDRVVIEAFLAAADRHVSVFALLMWLGFRRDFVEYDKQPRVRGVSGWTLAKKLRLVVDTVVGFSDFPAWWCIWGGLGLAAVGVLMFVSAALTAPANTGLWLLAAVMLGLAGAVFLAMGVMGQYLWRALDEARGRPAFAVEARTMKRR